MKKDNFAKVISLVVMVIGGVALAANKRKEPVPRRAPFFLKFLFIFVFVMFAIIIAFVFVSNKEDIEYLRGIIAVREEKGVRIEPKKIQPYIYIKKEEPKNAVITEEYYPPAWFCDPCGRCSDIFGNEWQSAVDSNVCK